MQSETLRFSQLPVPAHKPWSIQHCYPVLNRRPGGETVTGEKVSER